MDLELIAVTGAVGLLVATDFFPGLVHELGAEIINYGRWKTRSTKHTCRGRVTSVQPVRTEEERVELVHVEDFFTGKKRVFSYPIFASDDSSTAIEPGDSVEIIPGRVKGLYPTALASRIRERGTYLRHGRPNEIYAIDLK